MKRDAHLQLALPAEVVEDLLRRHQLHLEQIQSLDGDSHRRLTDLVKRTVLHSRRDR